MFIKTVAPPHRQRLQLLGSTPARWIRHCHGCMHAYGEYAAYEKIGHHLQSYCHSHQQRHLRCRPRLPSSSAPGTTTARVPDDLGSPAPGKTTVRVRDDLGSSAPDTTTVRVPNDLGSPVPRTATTPVSLHGHGDAPWLHWLPRQPGQSQQSATRRLHMRLHANTCAAGRVCTHTNKKLASYSAYMNSNQASRLRQESNSRQSSR